VHKSESFIAIEIENDNCISGTDSKNEGQPFRLQDKNLVTFLSSRGTSSKLVGGVESAVIPDVNKLQFCIVTSNKACVEIEGTCMDPNKSYFIRLGGDAPKYLNVASDKTVNIGTYAEATRFKFKKSTLGQKFFKIVSAVNGLAMSTDGFAEPVKMQTENQNNDDQIFLIAHRNSFSKFHPTMLGYLG